MTGSMMMGDPVIVQDAFKSAKSIDGIEDLHIIKSKAVLEVYGNGEELDIDLKGLDERARLVEEEIDKLVEYFKTGSIMGPISDEEVEDIKKSLASVTKLPRSAKSKIESMFKAAQKDLSKATDLKKELDKWNMYKEYEDRFLDLFRPRKKDNN